MWRAAYLRRTSGEEAQDQQTQLALLAVNRLLAANSELADLYADSSPGAEAEWRASADDLRRRLAGPARARPRLPLATQLRLMRTEAIERVLRGLLLRRGSS